MVITRRERKIEDSRLTRLNNKKNKNANLRKNMTILGSSMFVGAAVAEIADISTPTPVKAEALSVNNFYYLKIQRSLILQLVLKVPGINNSLIISVTLPVSLPQTTTFMPP